MKDIIKFILLMINQVTVTEQSANLVFIFQIASNRDDRKKIKGSRA